MNHTCPMGLALALQLLLMPAPDTRAAAPQLPLSAPDPYLSRLATLAATVQQSGSSAAALEHARQQLAQLAVTSAPTSASHWLLPYYEAYASIRLAFLAAPDAARQDQHLDHAQRALDQARAYPQPDAAELLVLQAYLYQARLTVAPVLRALRYSSLTVAALDQAAQLAPANPRLHYIRGNDSYYKPRLLGGGAAAAQTSYARAQACFAAFQPATPYSPSWGAPQTQAALARCRQKLAN